MPRRKATTARELLLRRFDDAAVLAALTRTLLDGAQDLGATDHVILEALRRSTGALTGASVETIQTYLQGLDEGQILGVVSQTKGITHELLVAEMEATDGDAVSAILFEDTNHPGTDLGYTDAASGDAWEVQVKATDSEAYVRDWIDRHPEGHIAVTDELAGKMGLPSTGISNETLTMDVEDLIDRLRTNSGLWDHLPWLSLASSSILVAALVRRYRAGEVTGRELFGLSAAALGRKTAKMVLLLALLSIPVVNVATGAVLVARLLITLRRMRSSGRSARRASPA